MNSLPGMITFTNTAPFLLNGLPGIVFFMDARRMPPIGVPAPDFGIIRTAVFNNKTVQKGQNEQRTALDTGMLWQFKLKWGVLYPAEEALLLDQFIRCRGKGKPFIFVNPEDNLEYVCRHDLDEQEYGLFAAQLTELSEITIVEVDEEVL